MCAADAAVAVVCIAAAVVVADTGGHEGEKNVTI